MKFFHYQKIEVSSKDFINFWSHNYNYPNDNLYTENIREDKNEDRIWKLFQWKNGGSNISKSKRRSIQSIYLPELTCLPNFTCHNDGREYLKKLKGGAVWGIFWIHCINPELFPIFDQHTYRSMADILSYNSDNREIPDDNNTKINLYFDCYINFFNKFPDKLGRNIDKALFCYGRFLKKPFGRY